MGSNFGNGRKAQDVELAGFRWAFGLSHAKLFRKEQTGSFVTTFSEP